MRFDEAQPEPDSEHPYTLSTTPAPTWWGPWVKVLLAALGGGVTIAIYITINQPQINVNSPHSDTTVNNSGPGANGDASSTRNNPTYTPVDHRRPQPGEPYRDGNVEVTPRVGYDKERRWAIIDICTLNGLDYWAFNQHDRSEDGAGNLKPIQEIFDKLRNSTTARAVTVIGVASQEGELEKQNRLAQKRLQELLRFTMDRFHPKPVYSLQLGRHDATLTGRITPDDTAYQRRLVILAIRDYEPGLNLDEALADALAGSFLKPREYPLWRLEYQNQELSDVKRTPSYSPRANKS